MSQCECLSTHGIWITRWRRYIRCLKLRVSFRRRTTNYRALLRKETYNDQASYASSPPCTFDTLDESMFAHSVCVGLVTVFVTNSWLVTVFVTNSWLITKSLVTLVANEWVMNDSWLVRDSSQWVSWHCSWLIRDSSLCGSRLTDPYVWINFDIFIWIGSLENTFCFLLWFSLPCAWVLCDALLHIRCVWAMSLGLLLTHLTSLSDPHTQHVKRHRMWKDSHTQNAKRPTHAECEENHTHRMWHTGLSTFCVCGSLSCVAHSVCVGLLWRILMSGSILTCSFKSVARRTRSGFICGSLCPVRGSFVTHCVWVSFVFWHTLFVLQPKEHV